MAFQSVVRQPSLPLAIGAADEIDEIITNSLYGSIIPQWMSNVAYNLVAG